MVIKKVLTSIRELFLPLSSRFLVRFQSKLQFHRNQRWPTVEINTVLNKVNGFLVIEI